MRKIYLLVLFLFATAIAFCQNPLLLKDVYPGSTGSGIQQIVKTSNYTFFNAEDDDADTDRGLYRTDGTVAGTIKLNLTYPTYASTKAEKLTALGDKIIFAGDNFANYGEIWASDGTQAGTIALERFQPTLSNRIPVMDIAKVGSEVIYGVVNTNNHAQLRKTNGTAAGTSLVYDFSGFTIAPELGLFKMINNVLYFNVYDSGGSGVDQLWRSDGTTAGTYMLQDFGLTQFAASWYMPAGSLFYFMIVNTSTGNVLWKSDGTVAGTLPLKVMGSTGNNNYPQFAATTGNNLAFAGRDANGLELWTTDGTEVGTHMIADINSGATSSNPSGLVFMNNTLYFSATTSTSGIELWKSDGTAPGTALLKDINPGAASSVPGSFVISNNTIIFRAGNATDGSELWITDGTSANTLQIKNLNPGVASSSPNFLTPDNPVYFSATDGVNGSEIFKYDNSQGIQALRQHKIYVNDNSTSNDVFTTAVGNNANDGFSSSPFATINYAISVAQPGDTIIVDAGSYPERILVNKSLYFKGAYSGVNPGASLNRGASETILVPSTENNLLEIVTVQVPNVSFDGFLFDGNNPAITGLITLNGVDINAGMGIFNGNLQTDSLVVKNNIFKNFFRYGIFLQRTTGPVIGNIISRNHIDNVPSRTPRDGRGVGLFNNAYAAVTDNYMTRVNSGVIVANFTAGSTDSLLIASNIIEAYSFGVNVNVNNGLTSSIVINNNQLTVSDLVAWSAPGSSTVNNCTGINIGGLTSTKNVSINNNTVTGTRTGFNLNQLNTTDKVLLSNNIVIGTETGIGLSSIITPQGVQVNGGTVSNSSQLGLFYTNAGVGAAKLTLSNVSLVNNVVGIDASAADNNTMQLEFSGVTINGGVTGIRFYGKPISLPASTLSGISFLNQSKEYILQTFHSFEDQTIDASTVSFDGIVPTDMTLAQLFATEDKLTHKIDFDSVGYFKLKPRQVYVTKNSFAATLPLVFGTPTFTPELRRAVNAAAAGDTINVGEGTYVLSADLTINKAVTILGSNYLLSPNDANDKRVLNAVRNAESIVSNATLIIGSNDISIQGMVLDPGSAAIAVFFSNSNYNNISLAKNRIKMNSTSPSIRFEGTGTNTIAASALVNSGFTINDNRFEKYDAGNSSAITISRLKNITVTGNAFVVGGSTLRNYSAIFMGNVGVVDAVNFSGNTIDRALNAITGSRIGNALLNGNKIYNTSNAFSSTNASFESSNVEFSSNVLDGSAGVFPFVFYTRNGGSIAGSSSLFKSENNTITGTAVPSTTTILGSYNITFSNTVLSPSLIIRNNIFNYAGDLSTVEGQFLRPISIKGNLANATVDHNELTLSGFNLQPKNPANILPVCPAISLYTDNGPTSGIPAGAVINILNNKITGFKHSFVVFDPVNGSDAYIGFGNLGPNISVNVHENSFSADSMSINNGSVGNPIDASCNWYGSSAIQNLVSKLSTDLDNIYVPYLSNGTDNDVATGFQPVPGSCYGQPLQARLDGFTNVTCNGANNGTASVTVFNGVAPFVFAWTKTGDPLFSSNVEDPTNFGPGTYHLSITDALGTNIILDENNDIRTIDVAIVEPPLLTANAGGTNVNCFGGSNGSATVTAGGGTPSYSYLWSNGATTSSISNLIAGTYNVTVTDGNGCNKSASYNVTQPPLLVATTTGTNVSCFGGNNGTANVSVSGGTTSYSYLWNNGSTTQSINNLIAGTYSVTVTDAGGCTSNSSYNVTQPALLVATASGTNVSCFGGNNGTATVSVTGGTTLYSFLWSNGATTQTINNLLPGNYSVTITDAKGCSASSAYTVTQPAAALTVVLTGTKASCVGSVTATPSGGTTPYSYLWSNGGNTQTINGVPNGTYTVTVTDAKNCTTTGSYAVTGNSPINPTTSQINVSCFGGSNGSITVTGAGGTPPHTYSINGSPYQSNNVFSNLIAGTYLVGVKDATGCFDFVSRTITQPTAALTVVLDSVRNACFATNNGRIYITANGGTGTKTYNWTGPNGFTSTVQDPINLFGGTYNVTVTDTKGCTATLMVNVIERPQAAISEVITHVGCKGDFSGAINVTVIGGSGTGFTYKWTGPNGFIASTEDIAAIKAGSYTLVATDNENGCTVTKVLVVNQPATNVSLTTARTNATGCNSLGTITGTGSNGTPPYQYSLNGISYQSSNLFTGLYAGTDTIWVRDANGCTTFKPVTITDNGSDEFEANNAQNKAALITINATNTFARIAPLATDVDWFKFTTGNVASSHTVTLTHPSVNYTFALYNSAGTLIVPTSTGAVTKTYASLAVNTTYSIKVTGALSYVCYYISVSNTSSSARTVMPITSETKVTEFKNGKPLAIIVEALKAIAYPNPHHGIFDLLITSPESGWANIELFNASGQKVITKNVLVNAGENKVNFNNIKESLLLYKITIGKNSVTGKVIGPN